MTHIEKKSPAGETFAMRDDWHAALKNRLLRNTSIVVLSLTAITHGTAVTQATAQTAEPAGLDEIVVTAQKRTENLQDVPISVQALSGSRLDDLGIANFDEVAALVPSVSITSLGPGNAQIYMRGITNGGDGNPSGSNPSVAVYLDDQPVTAIDRVLDVHMYDIARVEALAGPQGTLYGASSQAGTLKIITNPPDPSAYAASYDVGLEQTENGELSYSLEGFVNIPISDKMALRLVGWSMKAGGYIDNVLATRQFNPGGGAGTRYDGPTISNAAYVKDDFNEEETQGLRAALRIDLDDNWVANLRILHQKQETKGVWDHDPEGVGDLQVNRFFVDESEDEFIQAAVTIEGQLGDVDLIYAGSYLDRDVEYMIDYSEYVNYSDFIGFYTCYYEPGYVCRDPRIQYYGPAEYKTTTHEMRISTNPDEKTHVIAGMFYQNAKHDYLLDYRIPDISAGQNVDNHASGLFMGHSPFSYFVTDQDREVTETAFFGEISYDVTEQMTITGGVRSFDIENKLRGVAGSIYSEVTAPTNLTTNEDGRIYKLNLSYIFSDTIMVYATYSEGFRAGGVNRAETTNIPRAYVSDLVRNHEIGWKTTLRDGTLRLNGALFMMDWEDMQIGRFEPSESILGLTANAGDAETTGIEIDMSWLATPQLTLDIAATYIPTAELLEDYIENVGESITAPKGTRLPFVPELQANITIRYQFDLMNRPAFFQASGYYTDDSYNDIDIQGRQKQASYNYANASIGIDEENWGVTLYVNNLTDERGELYRNIVDYDERITTNRPRTIGVRFSQRF